MTTTLRQFKRLIYRQMSSPMWWWVSRCTKPLSNCYGCDRGKPIDRYYIENFLFEHRENIKGHCLELLNDNYIKCFGDEKVSRKEILDIDSHNSHATLIGDLKNLKSVNDNTFDCIILTQVLQFIDDTQKAISECYRILKPGGAILASVPSVSRVDCAAGENADFWRFTTSGARYLFANHFAMPNLEVRSWGNAKIGAKFLAGLALEEVPRSELDYHDKNFPCLVTIFAKK